MDILILTSHEYCMPYCVMLTSLLRNNPGEVFNLHVMIGPGLSEGDKSDIIGIMNAGKTKSNSVTFYEVGDVLRKLFEKLPVDRKDRIKTVYSKLFVDKILPESLDKVLWLDGDLVVRHSLIDLWNTDISDHPVAYVRDVGNNDIGFFNRLKYPYNDGYFNTGVILINLKYWREHDVYSKMMFVLENYQERIKILDQDVYSLVFHNNKIALPFKYNFQTWLFYAPSLQRLSLMDYEEEIKVAAEDPVIYHYIGSDKPWMKYCSQPGKEEWAKYQAMTKWGNRRYKNPKSMRKLIYVSKVKETIKRLLHMPLFDMYPLSKKSFLMNKQ